MRYSGRPTIRPVVSSVPLDIAPKVGDPIDAWWSDGWWEGVVTATNDSGNENCQVYIAGKFLILNSFFFSCILCFFTSLYFHISLLFSYLYSRNLFLM